MASEAIHSWLFDSISDSIAAAFEALAGESLQIEWQPITQPLTGGLSLRQSFENLPGSVWFSGDTADCDVFARQIIRVAGIEVTGPETLRSAFRDLLSRATDELIGRLGSRTALELSRGPGLEENPDDVRVRWARLNCAFQGGLKAGIQIGIDHVLSDALPAALGALAPTPTAAPFSKTLDLLLDVELPVSVSFGRAQIALKDVLKLTTGSILELERTISEPVDVIVNNCAIARGEVVVVEGNFGVRILQVISRQERLRTVA